MDVIKNILRSIWNITDGGPVQWFINLKFSRDRRNGIMKIDQSNYAEIKLRQFGLESEPAPLLPMCPDFRLSDPMGPDNEHERERLSKVPYRAMTGSLNYFRLTRPARHGGSIFNQFPN